MLICISLMFASPGIVAGPQQPWEAFFQPFLGDLAAEARDAGTAGKAGVVLVFQQDPCDFCEHLKEKVLSDARVQAFYGRHFTAVSIDIRGSVELTDFGGRRVKESEFARDQLAYGGPLVAFHDQKGRFLTRVVGRIESPEEFLALGEFVLSRRFERQDFRAFKAARGLGNLDPEVRQYRPAPGPR